MASRTTSLPRNENDRLLTPPLILTPGHVALMMRAASMKFFANSLCSSMPVAIARMFGSKMMSVGSNPTCSGQQRIGTLADRHLARDGLGLPLLVKRHHDHAGAIAADRARLGQEVGLAFLQADRIDDALALDALESGFDDRPLRAVDHERNPRDFRLGRQVVQERRHGALGVEHAFVHVDVEDVGAAAHLIERDLDGLAVVGGLDQPRELRRSGDVGPLADHLEVAVGADDEGFEPGKPREGAARAEARVRLPQSSGPRCLSARATLQCSGLGVQLQCCRRPKL